MVKLKLRPNFYFDIVNLLIKGLNPTQISRQLGISKQLVNYHISSLKRNNLIRKIAYGTWECDIEKLKETSKVKEKDGNYYLTSNSIRGHGFVFKVYIKHLKNWNKRTEILNKLKIPYELIGIAKNTPRIVFRGHKIWLSNDSLTIYYPEGKSYFTDTSNEAYNHSIYDLKQLIIGLENLLEANFKIQGNYSFSVSKQHYSLVKNALAHQYDKENKKLFVYSADNSLRFIIDNSYQLNEFEGQHQKTAISDTTNTQTFFNQVADMKDFTPENVMKMIKGIADNQVKTDSLVQHYDKNIVKHFEVLKGIEEAIKQLKDTLEKK